MRPLPTLAYRTIAPAAALLCTLSQPSRAQFKAELTSGRGVSAMPARNVVDSLLMIDLKPVAGRDFQSVYLEAIAQVRALGRTPFVEYGAPWCGPCNHLLDKIKKPPIEPNVLQRFSGVGLIRINVDDWKDTSQKKRGPGAAAQIVMGVDSVIGIPEFFAIDTTGRQVAHVYGPEWILDEEDIAQPDGPPADRDFFLHHLWKGNSGKKAAKKASKH